MRQTCAKNPGTAWVHVMTTSGAKDRGSTPCSHPTWNGTLLHAPLRRGEDALRLGRGGRQSTWPGRRLECAQRGGGNAIAEDRMS